MISDTKLFELLDCNSTEEEQKKGIELALQRTDLEIFIRNKEKNVWYNCAIILTQKSDEELKPYLPQLLEWMQDLNSPGVIILFQRLQLFNKDLFKRDFETAVIKANKTNNTIWLKFLSYFLESKELTQKISLECLKMVEQNEDKIKKEDWNTEIEWNSSEEKRKNAIEFALQLKKLSPLIETHYGKSAWNNNAKILAQKSDLELVPYLSQLLEWIQDLKQSGAVIILDRLKKFNIDLLLNDFEMTIVKAYRANDIDWIEFLSELLNEEFLKIISPKCLQIIEENKEKIELFDLLDWNSSEEEQRKGIEIGSQRKDLSIFLQIYGKDVWKNSAKILVQKTDDELKPYLPQLLEWLQDLNWPGALIILDRLKKFNVDLLLNDFENTIQKANLENDMNWIDFLSYILENKKMESRISKNCRKIIDMNKLKLESEAD